MKSSFFKPWSAGNQNSKTFKKTVKVNKHIPVLDIAKIETALISGIAEIWPWKNAMWSEFHSKWCNVKWCFEGSVLQDTFFTCFSSDHNRISMANVHKMRFRLVVSE